MIQQSGGTTRTLNAGLDVVKKMRAELAKQTAGAHGAQRAGRRHGLRRLGRHQRHHRQSRGRPLLRLADRERRRLHLRGDRRAHRLRAHHGLARRSRPSSAREIEACVDKAANYYRIMGYGSFAPGNAEGGLTTLEEKSMGAYSKSGSSPICGPHQARRRAAARRAVPARRRARRRAALRLSEHLRQRRDRRADRLRLAPHAVHHRPRLGGRLGHLAGHQGLRQSGHLRAHGRRHGRRMPGRILQGAELDEVGREIFELVQKRRGRRADEVRSARPPGIHPHLQTIRAHRPGLPAGGLIFPGEII